MASIPPAEKYWYRQLQRTPPEIRLFVLLPGEDAEPLRGRITHHVLDPDLAFDALSYAWGDATHRFVITVDDDKQLGVAANLHAALGHLRHPTDNLRIWIDAICINQADHPERSFQVGLMHSIYSQPQVVRAYLDQDVDASHPSIQTLISFASVDLEHLDSTAAAELSPVADLGSGVWDPVLDILKNRYWGRLWVQQELILPPKFSVHCRRVVIPGEAIIAYNVILGRALAPLYESSDASSVDALRRSVEKMRFFDAPSRDIYHLRHQVHDVSYQDGPVHGFAQRCSLLGNLLQYSRMDATEPRDKLYGLLGFSLDVSAGDIAVDYQISLPEAYADVARFCIDKYANVNFLCHCQLKPSPAPSEVDSDEPVFPSWLPNWPTMDETMRGATFMDERPRAGGSSCPRGATKLSSDRRSLFVRGFRVDTIATATAAPFLDAQPIASVLDSLREIFRAVDLAVDDDAIVDVFARGEGRHVSAARHSNRFRATKAALSRLESLARKTPTTGLRDVAFMAGTLGFEQANERRAVRRIVDCLNGRRVARLGTGKWGILPDGHVRPGDEVWILFGCAYPVILQPAGGGVYRVVSPMHVHGLMDGEAVEGLADMDTPFHGFGVNTFAIATVELV
ncbi:heterokaryon incompatibility protein-domain-containing protein [Lasiosphaeria ovina]|uniref:Heterokaryon incompatibility protein-domain-containing protein n=1 Tax=Lasiosphaeria ovina TaxID=92902 RepID=A0AAE0JWI7_9PEZI|nr:heterokaryon incompatibility protein-domain-containing protein [Lasiosphaeria ovina]